MLRYSLRGGDTGAVQYMQQRPVHRISPGRIRRIVHPGEHELSLHQALRLATGVGEIRLVFMSGPLRIETPGGLYRVMSRGHEHRRIMRVSQGTYNW